MIDPGPVCRDERRRAHLLAHPSLNGIDYVEYEHRPAAPLHVLVVSFLKPLPQSGPDGAYGLTTELGKIHVLGGARIVGIEVEAAAIDADGRLEIAVDRAGDFSDYQLLLGWQLQPDGTWGSVVPDLDPQYSRATINFKAGCPVDFDCRALEVCPPEVEDEPLIDYLAKDYASFRQLLLDRIPELNPDWLERSPADLGIALVELLAYEGDQLSYFQDTVANEAVLDTARKRLSAKRHARLVDYRMHDGRNAWTHVHVAVDDPGTIDRGTPVLSRIAVPLPHQTVPPETVIPKDDLPEGDTAGGGTAGGAFERHPVLSQVAVFETARPAELHPENNTLFVHAWGDLECCLPRGATRAHLYTVTAAGQAVLPRLVPGDLLLFEEVKGPLTGAAADADPEHRQVVEILEARDTKDQAYGDQLANGELQPWQSGATLPLQAVTWGPVDGLGFPLCLSARPPGRPPLENVSVARGNVIPADHGRTLEETIPLARPVAGDASPLLRLGSGPLTHQCQPDEVEYNPATGELATARPELACAVDRARPALSLRVDFPTGQELWQAVPDLLDSPPFAAHFVADVDRGGRATLRFGDGEHGRRPVGATGFTATYRVGNGRRGNVGAEALAHVVRPPVAGGWPTVRAVRNPLAARGGADAESIDEVRQRAPGAFHAEQFRAVTEGDWAAAARKLPEVAEAVATFRWTGSWHTVFVGVDPRRPEDLITEPGGRTRLDPDLERRVGAFLERYRLAGYDLEIRSAEYVPLEIDLELCIVPGYFRADVVEAVRRALDNRLHPDGRRGFFHPDRFTFGQPLYLSRLYAAVEAVPGVESVVVARCRRWGELDNGELEAGLLPIGSWEIARLDNDRNFMENGVLRIQAGGGK